MGLLKAIGEVLFRDSSTSNSDKKSTSNNVTKIAQETLDRQSENNAPNPYKPKGYRDSAKLAPIYVGKGVTAANVPTELSLSKIQHMRLMARLPKK